MSTRTLLGSFVLGLLVVACSGEDEDAGNATESPAADATGSSGSRASTPGPSSASSSGSTPAATDSTARGAVDKTFGVDGIAAGIPEALTRQLAVDANGNYLVTGTLKSRVGFVTRYSPEGKLDESLGEAGVLQLTMGETINSTTLASWNVPLPDGSFLVVGGSVTDKGVARSSAKLFDAKGKPVTSFATNGELSLTGEAFFTHGARLADGSFILAGTLGSLAMGSDLVVVKLTPKGEPDQAFGTKGITTLSHQGSEMSVGLVIDSLQRIVVAGVSPQSASGLVWRLTPTGKTDPWYGGGFVETAVGAHSLTLGKDNTVYVAGRDKDTRGAVVAISTAGTVLPGSELLDLPSELTANKSASFRVAFDGAGLFMVGGWASGKGTGEFDHAFSMVLDSSAKVSSTLPRSGYVSIPTMTSAIDVVVSSDRAVVLGTTTTNGFALTRVWR